MHKKLLSVLLILLFVNLLAVRPVQAQREPQKRSERTQKIKTNIAKLGVGPEARVKVKLRDKTKLEGYISETGTDTFNITHARTGKSTTVPYSQVSEINGGNLSTGTKVAIGIGIGLLGVFITGLVLNSVLD